MAYSLVRNVRHDILNTGDDIEALENIPVVPSEDQGSSTLNNRDDICTPSATKASHQRGWSDTTAVIPHNYKPVSLHSDASTKYDDLPKPSTWTFEIITIFVSLGAVASIIGVLARFNGHGLPEWPYYITLNALIALLATVTNATLSVSLSSGMGQLKWVQLKQSGALKDMEVFDEASRGTWGAIKLLATAKGGYLVPPLFPWREG